MDNSKIKKGNPMLPRILQLLPTVHRRIQQNSKTALRENRKETRQQMGVGRKGTTSIRRNEKETHYRPGTGPLRPLGTTQNRDRRLEICLHGDPVATMQGRQM